MSVMNPRYKFSTLINFVTKEPLQNITVEMTGSASDLGPINGRSEINGKIPLRQSFCTHSCWLYRIS